MSSPLDHGPIDQPARNGGGKPGRYRTVSAMAVASLAFGVLSSLTVLHWAVGLIPAVGVLLGYLALRRIAEVPEEMTGRGLAFSGLILSVVFGTLGYTVLAVAKVREFPSGYDEITHRDLQPDPNVPGQQIPPKAYDSQYVPLRDNRVGIKGYMAPTRYQSGLKQFILCPAIPNCQFCTPDPKPTEMVLVRLQGDREAKYTTHEIKVGGRFRVDEDSPFGTPYLLEADYLQ